MTGGISYYQNKVTDEHEAQRERDKLTMEAIKTDIEANCPKLKPNGVSVKINIRDGRGFAVEGFRFVELKTKTLSELGALAMVGG